MQKASYMEKINSFKMFNNRSNFYNIAVTSITTILLATFFLNLLATQIICILMGVIILLCLKMNQHSKINTVNLCMYLFLFITLLYQLNGNGESFNNYLFRSLYFLTGLSLTNSLNRLTKGQQQFLFFFFLLLFSFSVFMTFGILLVEPMAIRYYGYGASETEIYLDSPSLFGMYSYGIGETFSFMIPSLLCFSLGSKNFYLKCILLAMLILGIVTQYMSTLTTSFFLSLGASFLVFISFYKKAGIKKLLLIALVAIPIFIYIASSLTNLDNTQFLAKIEDIEQSFDSGQSSGQVKSRFDLYAQSIMVFLSNPILGLGNIQSHSVSYAATSVSSHCTIFDYFGLYGLFALLLFVPWRKILYNNLRIIPQQIFRIYKIPLFALFCLLLLKGPVTIGTNFFFSTFLLKLLYYNEHYRIENSNSEILS